MNNKILFVEDEASLAMIVKDGMEAGGFVVNHCLTAEEGLKQYFQDKPDLIVLDVMLPKSDGFSIAKTIRNTDQKTPIIFLTAKAKVKDVVSGFESGGNDYLKKPFSVEELIIRMKVLLSNNRLLNTIAENETSSFEIGNYFFDSIKQLLIYNDNQVQLTARESELLKLFCQNPNRLIAKKNILLKIWGDDSFFNSRSMDVFISKLRKHLKKDPAVKIINVRGAGYKLIIG